jgi:hypothetical protein
MDNDRLGKDQLSRLADASRNVLSPSGESAKCTPELAAVMATRLFGFYRASEANDPETFIAGATAMLANYSEAIVRKVCDPLRGLPSTNQWLPSIAEIRTACETEMVWYHAVERRERVRDETLARRDDSRKAPVGSPEHVRVVEGFKSLRAVLGEPAIKERPATMLDARHAPTPEIRERAIAFHEAKLEALKAEYSARPPVISPELVKSSPPLNEGY